MKTIEQLKKLLIKNHPDANPVGISAHGRLEIVGNHTDHNNGKCLVAGCSLGTFGALAASDSDEVEVISIGYPDTKVNINDVAIDEKEYGTTTSLVKGVIKGFIDNKLKVGGFYLYVDSDIFNGAGVSSSACFESLICKALSYLFNDDKVSPLVMARISQYAEREHFGKPCGMLDQIGSCFGDICYLDFGPAQPIVEPLKFQLPVNIVLVNTGGSHANLTPYYASIPADMKTVAAYFGKNVLREVDPAIYAASKVQPLAGISMLAQLRSQHYFDENVRVDNAKVAVENNDKEGFYEAIRHSQYSSKALLQNTMVPGEYTNSPQEAVDRANAIIKDGAVRIMGGGFAGSIICFIAPEETKNFVKEMSKFYGKDHVVQVSVPKSGPEIIK